MNLPRIHLRDLFWLCLVVGLVMSWLTEHKRFAPIVAELEKSWRFHSLWFGGGSEIQQTRMAERASKIREYRCLSKDELKENGAIISGPNPFDDKFEIALCEMVHRNMEQEISDIYNQRMENFRKGGELPDNLVLLTALRRAQHKPDPLKFHLEHHKVNWTGKKERWPFVGVKIENCDAEREPFEYSWGGDDRSGRRTRWKVRLVDSAGVQIPDADFPSFSERGGIGFGGPVEFGKCSESTVIDLRNYVKPPPTGRYRLSLLHSNQDIADETNLDGRIVWESQPIVMDIENHTFANFAYAIMKPGILSLVGCTSAIVLAMRAFAWRTSLSFITKRDVWWSGLSIFITLVWLVDVLYLQTRIQQLTPDHKVDWSLKIIEKL